MMYTQPPLVMRTLCQTVSSKKGQAPCQARGDERRGVEFLHSVIRTDGHPDTERLRTFIRLIGTAQIGAAENRARLNSREHSSIARPSGDLGERGLGIPILEDKSSRFVRSDFCGCWLGDVCSICAGPRAFHRPFCVFLHCSAGNAIGDVLATSSHSKELASPETA